MADANEIEVHRSSTLAPVGAGELDTLVRQSELLAASDIIPSSYRHKPANVLVAAMTGRTFGWDVMTAMRNGHVIEGAWTLKPEAMLGLVRQAGHSVSGDTSPDGATVTGKRADTGDELTVTFTLNDAVRARLCQIKDGKPWARSERGKVLPWEAYPQAMCWARAVSQLCRMLFADVTLGLSYTPEELGAEVGEDGSVIEADSRRVPELPEGHEWTGPAKQRVVEAADGDKSVAGEAWHAANPSVHVIDQDYKYVSKLDVDLAVAEAERLLVLATEGDDEEDRDGEDQAEAEDTASEVASQDQTRTYSPDDPERPFAEGENEKPWRDPTTGAEF